MSENKKLRVIVGDENPDWGQKIKRWFGKDFPNVVVTAHQTQSSFVGAVGRSDKENTLLVIGIKIRGNSGLELASFYAKQGYRVVVLGSIKGELLKLKSVPKDKGMRQLLTSCFLCKFPYAR
ncbi:MAG: hypothetical protein UU80_C0013G0013 [candidate division WWE3 bacterium GW2011_GWA1_41_8]|uniref:Response regulatory domain-containing protein n=1 Tax=candidate division WWE3 bacterium GW2011_GWA1_41_8 TaxID=1619103 RepID=A0A0G0XB01_UNCKA|nr:MAG: hypothetical protein UU80_C0013G0013 [candidate division WWE3 bacterium GW2011_GWA1_41_8]